MIRSNRSEKNEVISFAILLVGIAIISLMIFLVMRIGRGLLGIVLAVLTAGLLVYWLREFRKSVRREFAPRFLAKKQWNYDLLEEKDVITLVAEVPGSTEDIKVRLNDRVLEIVSRRDFRKEVRLSEKVEILNMSCVNGVLNVKFKKLGSVSQST